MNCPICHANSVIITEGRKQCQAKHCPYLQFHVISYKDEVRNFEDKQVESRYSYSSNYLEFDKGKQYQNFMTNQKKLQNLAEVMQFPDAFVKLAQTKLRIILKMKMDQKKKEKQEKQKQKNNEVKQKFCDFKITVTDHIIVGYAFYCACFDKGLFFKDVRIANQLGICKKDWYDALKNLNSNLANTIKIPKLTLEQEMLRVPTKRKINEVEKKAMVQMILNFKNYDLAQGARNTTICAFVFMQIMKRSKTYYENFNINNYLKAENENEDQFWRQTHFEISLLSINKFWKDKESKIGKKIIEFIPDFQTRIHESLVSTKATKH